jgi:hypothetical protein
MVLRAPPAENRTRPRRKAATPARAGQAPRATSAQRIIARVRSGEDEDRGLGIGLAHRAETLDARHARHLEIEDGEVDGRRVREPLQRGSEAVDVAHVGLGKGIG